MKKKLIALIGFVLILMSIFGVVVYAEDEYSSDLTDGLPTTAFTASSTYSSNYEAPKAFNNIWDGYNSPNSFFSASGANSWIKVDFATSKAIAKLKYQADAVGNYGAGMKNFKVQGSSNDIDWVDQFTGVALQNGSKQEFFWTPTNSFRYWRVFWIDTHTIPSYVAIAEMEMSDRLTYPTNLVAVTGDALTNLSWKALATAVGYNVYRSETINGNYTKIASNVAAASYTDNTVLNGVEYYYKVTALNPDGESRQSDSAFSFPQASALPYTNNIIPIMTSNTSSGGIVTASDEYTGRDGTLPAWKAFDGIKKYSSSTSNYSAWGTHATQGWLAYEFPLPKTVVRYVLDFGAYSNVPYANDAPKKWTFEGTNDNVNWTILDSRDNITHWVDGDSKAFTFENNIAFKKYRINISANNGSTTYNVNLDIHELEMMERAVPSIPAITNLVATAGDAQVILTWSSVTGATGYNVKRSTTANGPYATVASNVYGSPYTDTTVTNGTKYYYVVTALNAGGESINSNEASTTPMGTSRVILTTTMTNGDIFEYNISKTELTAFLNWYDSKAAGTGPAKYTFVNQHLKGSFLVRNNNLIFDKILKFNYDEYGISGSGTPTEAAEITTGTALSITLTNGKVEEFILSSADYNAFVAWHDAKSAGTGPARYTFENPLKKGPFLARHEVVIFDKISSYDSEDFN
ncbi:discoidin domain-containing protein [Paenibacillus periandrae]|uniref:discoidin domain-containing protein n=1 Tax=Paenibacillus periandrae TaxID=1761741 RepID=UPI001F09896B|nr:discoidin domain-containing protein [Paenibacillus periandrae]